MKRTHSIIKNAGTGITTLLLYGAIVQTGLFARDEGGLTVKPFARGEAERPINDDKDADQADQKMEIIAVLSWENNTWILNSLDGKKYTVVNPHEQKGIGRLPVDILYCTVTLVEKTPEGGDVFLGPWGNGSPSTEKGKQLEIEFWEKIKAKKRELGDKQWLEFHGDQPAPPQR